MECNDKITKLLGDYFSGHLTLKQEAEVESHLAQCQSCRKALDTMGLLAADPSSTLISDHIAADQMALYYRERKSLSQSEQAGIRAHIGECNRCAYDYQFLRDMETDLAQSVKAEMVPTTLLERIWRAIPVMVTKPALAYFLLALTIYPAMQYLAGGPEPAAISETGAVYQSFELFDANRSGGEMPIVTRADRQETTKLVVPQYHSIESFSYSFSIQNADLTQDLNAEVLSLFEQEGSIVLLVNLRDLSDGDYVLSVTEVDREDPTDTSLSHYSFRLSTSQQ